MIQKNKSLIKFATMRDVARLAGVSLSTVSRVTGKTAKASIAISDETRERVLAAARELNYQPNRIAQSLRLQQTFIIALLVADISNAYYHPIIRAIQTAAQQRHYEVIVYNSDYRVAVQR